MSQVCEICGKKKVSGGHITHRGLSKKAGGIGLQRVKNVKRIFKPNIQKVKINHNGTVRRMKVCTSCLRSFKVSKA
ncbi:MAG: 50S ribosomal protein L28 [Lentisphaerae bacterium]|nr:MAG: 50S ribosomal protein L28 [Lentisphaerota bacterium]